MSIELARKEIARFLASPDPEVLCISGQWGVGKTYTWNHLLRGSQTANKIALDGYSYVSLFGLNSVAELKQAIFENRVSSADVAARPSLASVKASLRKYSRNVFGALSALPVVGSYTSSVIALAPLLGLTIEKQIICFDDLERKGRGLEIKDVLGLISFLREERDCKVVILSNTNALKDEAEAQFKDYLEKVVDIVLAFEPSAGESVAIALPKEAVILAERCTKLSISNIRLIKKIERLVNQVAPDLAQFHEQIRHQAISSLVVLGWIQFGENSPSIEFLAQREASSRTLREMFENESGEKKGEAPAEAAWTSALDTYGWGHLDEFDRALYVGVVKGYFDHERLIAAAKKMQEEIDAAEGNDRHTSSWRPLHDSFDDNAEEVCVALINGITDNIKYVDANNLDGAISLLRELGKESEADGLITLYVTTHRDQPRAFSIESQEIFRELRDAKFMSALREAQAAALDTRTPLEVIKQMDGKGGSYADYAIATKITEQEAYDAFKALRATELRKLIDNFVSSDRIINARQEERIISEVAKAALRRIGAESPLNAFRIRKYGNLLTPHTGQERTGDD